MYNNYSLSEMPIVKHFSYWNNWINNRDNPKFFEFNDVEHRSHKIGKPMLITGAWYDLFNHNSLHAFERFCSDSPSPEIAKKAQTYCWPLGTLRNKSFI